ncbi:acetoacetyl-CoA synthetase-like [Centruroides sculpturatus]|uniref:acetoacetyl-CoA synthetase-like n=1 Tax=Centruroides sculpturatus TaxID=218467 RepID=UPI000C6D2FE5|nr:acetoacetyl-CoA synthetase-like [Centruroides sculpturatus]
MEEIPEWFHECKFNYAENLLQFKDNRIALYLTGERQKEVKTVTYFELNQKVALYASALKYLGIRKGDCVVGKYKD